MDRTAKAQWKGDLKSGTGIMSTSSGVLSNAQYSFKTRFEQGQGTNPEELLAAAHAGCFSMALSHVLDQQGLTLDREGDGFAIKKSHLQMTAKVPGASEDAFQKAAQGAKENCPVSKLYKTDITLDAKLQS
jgi:osmotically inducible protein OsmC